MADGLRSLEPDELVHIVMPLADAEGRLPQIHSATSTAHRLRSKYQAVPARCLNLSQIQLCRSCFRLEIDPDMCVGFDQHGLVHHPAGSCTTFRVPYRLLNREETEICRRCW